ncbi:neo-calmodulin-like isoform X2 [Haliotis rufescens]|uniref:neo-calmodulin-like isoform X2 n=1 Tax=Haliotis rufescens TaxID=6454 RepID=UPI001EAFE687|nr:neo-calmodulin-like isoform X2 [Haliotis rufescens]
MAYVEGLTPGEAQEIKDAFHLFDKNDDKVISKDELGSVLRALGQNPTQKNIDFYMEQADTDASGSLSYDEFVRLVEKDIISQQEVEVQLKQAFQVFDKDKNELLDKTELFHVLTSMGEVLSVEDAEQILRLVDRNGDGKLNVTEFTNFLCERI